MGNQGKRDQRGASQDRRTLSIITRRGSIPRLSKYKAMKRKDSLGELLTRLDKKYKKNGAGGIFPESKQPTVSRPYVVECGGRTWDDRFVTPSVLSGFEYGRSGLSKAKSLTKEEAEAVVEKQGFGEVVLRSSFKQPAQ